MAISVVIGPSSELVSLAEAKDHCRITADIEDSQIAGFILTARRYAEGTTRRTFGAQTIDCIYDSYTGSWPRTTVYEQGSCFSIARLEFPVSPVRTVLSVRYVGADGGQALLDPSNYAARLDGSVAYIEPAFATVWPALRGQSAAIVARVEAGWTPETFPDDLRQALLMLIEHFYNNRGAVITGSTVVEVPMAAEAMLSGYRVARFPT